VDTAYQHLYSRLENSHWWFQGRADFILRLLRRLDVRPSAAILEVGCSAGPLVRRLQGAGYAHVTGIDVSEEAIRGCHAAGLSRTAVMDGTMPGFRDGSFDLVIASDVLEHIADEATALRSWARILRPGGRLVLFVPAFMFLWSSHDEVNHHRRRYTRAVLSARLGRAGFVVDRTGYWNVGLFLPVAGLRLIQRTWRRPALRTAGQLRPTGALTNAALFALLRLENRLLPSACPLPVGVSLFAIASRVSRTATGDSTWGDRTHAVASQSDGSAPGLDVGA
jgi:SAM-dependent methyltransferase